MQLRPLSRLSSLIAPPLCAAALSALALSALSLSSVACGGSNTSAKAQAPKPKATAQASARKALPPGTVAREDVNRVLLQGPPFIFRRMLFEEHIQGGRFVGWRILGLPEDWTIDLKPGDVVSTVNGFALEKPDDVWNAWSATASSPDIKIGLERAGKKHEVVLRIDGAPDPKIADALRTPPSARQPPKGTVVIEDRDPGGE